MKFLQYVNNYEMRALQRVQREYKEQNNFLSIIEQARSEKTRETVNLKDIWECKM